MNEDQQWMTGDLTEYEYDQQLARRLHRAFETAGQRHARGQSPARALREGCEMHLLDLSDGVHFLVELVGDDPLGWLANAPPEEVWCLWVEAACLLEPTADIVRAGPGFDWSEPNTWPGGA